MVTPTNPSFTLAKLAPNLYMLVNLAHCDLRYVHHITCNNRSIKKSVRPSTNACSLASWPVVWRRFAIGIFHVMTHAFFKALMFLGAGSVIQSGTGHVRRMGGLKKYMSYTYWTFMAGWLAICGVIPFSGFWSKDENTLEMQCSTTQIPSGRAVGTIAVTCTALPCARLMAMTFWGRERFSRSAGGRGWPTRPYVPLTTKVWPHDVTFASVDS